MLAGRFNYVTVVRNRPQTLGTWQVTTTSTSTADRVAQLLGGRVQQDSTDGHAEILTIAPTVDILLTGPDALLIYWQRATGHSCDGVTQSDNRQCACPGTLPERRAAAKQGRTCQPNAGIRFQLTSNPRLGTFGFACEDWSFVELVTTTQAALHGRELDDPVRARLGLRRSLHKVRSGMVLPYTRPVITLLGDHHPSLLVSDVEAGST